MLTKEQIDRLFDFCKRHHVHHYDIQLELVDHLANAIEEKMADDDRLSFEKALISVHAGFGVLGFASVVNARTASLSKQYVRLERQLFFSYFTWPKAAMTACLFLLLMLPLKFFDGDELSMFTQITLLLFVGVQFYFTGKSSKRIKKQKKKLLLTEIVYYESWWAGIYLIQRFSCKEFDLYNSNNHLVVVAVYAGIMLITILFFIGLLAYRDVTRQTYALARKQYPEVFEISG